MRSFVNCHTTHFSDIFRELQDVLNDELINYIEFREWSVTTTHQDAVGRRFPDARPLELRRPRRPAAEQVPRAERAPGGAEERERRRGRTEGQRGDIAALQLAARQRRLQRVLRQVPQDDEVSVGHRQGAQIWIKMIGDRLIGDILDNVLVALKSVTARRGQLIT